MSGEGRTCRHCGETLDEFILSRAEEEAQMSSEAARKFTDDLQDAGIGLAPVAIRLVQDLYDRSLPNLSPAETLYAFCGHLLSLPYPMVFSRDHNPARISDLIDQFCSLNNLSEPREDWDKRLNPKFYREVMKMDQNCTMHQQPMTLCTQCRDGAVNHALMDKNETIKDLRDVLIGISAEDCGCCRDHNHKVTHHCSRCRALEVLEKTK